jgi:hypothetical protein
MFKRLGKWGSAAIVFVVALAIWKANNGDITAIFTSLWNLLNKGADIAIAIWHSFLTVFNHVSATLPHPTPSPTST